MPGCRRVLSGPGLRRALAVAAILAASRAGGAAEPRPIFDGKSLAGWSGATDRWRVEDGAITAELPAGENLDHNEFLWWDGTVADFDLALEYRIEGVPSGNSGIQFRSERLPEGHAKGYQADLDDGKTWLGRIYDEHGRGLLVERGIRLAIAPDGRTWSDVFALADSIRAVVRADDWNRYRISATAALTARKEAFAVLDRVGDKEAVPVFMTLLDDAAIRAAVDRVYGKVNESPAAAKATMARLKKVWHEAPKWAIDHGRGRAVFNKACANCHMHGDAGGKLGPNLTGAWMNGHDYFVENLVDPNAVVGPDYQLTTVLTDDGRSINGIVAEETPESLVLRTTEGPVTVPLKSIEERSLSAKSLMPAGILESLPEDEFLALIAFLTAKP